MKTMSNVLGNALVPLVCALGAGCSAAGEASEPPGPGQPAPPGGGPAPPGGGPAPTGTGPAILSGPGGAGNGPGFEGCTGVSAATENTFSRGADIIIAIDQSSSMTDETIWVQNQLNVFAQMVATGGVDLRVVIIVEKPGGPVFENPVCVPPPLALPNCESNPPTFLHINQHVDSNDAFDIILQTYPLYAHVLRPGVTKHVVVITDDIPGNVSAAAFDARFQSFDPPLLGGYVFHAIVPFVDCYPFADAPPDGQYTGLAQARRGVASDLCLQDFQTVWNALLQNVSSTANTVLDCEWQIPRPPDGQTLDPNLVNVTYTGSGQQRVIGRVDSPADCAAVAGAWYYDHPQAPSRVVACPGLCAELQSGQAMQIDLVFGCGVVQAIQ